MEDTQLNASQKTAKIIVPDDRYNDLAVQPIFSNSEFDKAVDTKGYDVTVEKAIMCPCRPIGVKQGNPLCQSCGGMGWFFISKRKTLAVVQSMNKRTKYLNWSETDRGTAQITFKGIDKVSFMDRVTVLEVEATFSQTSTVSVSTNAKPGVAFAFLFYAPTEIEYLFVYTGVGTKPVLLLPTTDYTIELDHILFTTTINQYLKVNDDGDMTARIGVRYKHNPTYHILDINRETVKGFDRNDEFEGDYIPIQENVVNPTKVPLPVNSVGRKAHYVFDSPNLSGESLFDNTPDNE